MSSAHVYIYTFFNFELYKDINRFIQRYKLVKNDKNPFQRVKNKYIYLNPLQSNKTDFCPTEDCYTSTSRLLIHVNS